MSKQPLAPERAVCVCLDVSETLQADSGAQKAAHVHEDIILFSLFFFFFAHDASLLLESLSSPTVCARVAHPCFWDTAALTRSLTSVSFEVVGKVKDFFFFLLVLKLTAEF